MLNRAIVKNFKSLHNLDIELSPLTVLMGKNNAGKSSFIQALLLLFQSEGEDYIDLNGMLINVGQGKDALYENADNDTILFQLFDDAGSYTWKGTSQKDTIELETDGLEKAWQWLQTIQLHYLATNRIEPKALHDTSRKLLLKKQLGLWGEYAAQYLQEYGKKDIVPEHLRHTQALSENLLHQTEAWLSEICGGMRILTGTVSGTDKITLHYQFEKKDGFTNPVMPQNAGFGISYVLSVIAALLSTSSEKLIIIENPEAHLHPRGQAEIGRLIARTAIRNDSRIILETHSDHVINGIRVAIKEQENGITPDDVIIQHFFQTLDGDERFTETVPITIDKHGELSDYPENFLSEWQNLLMKLL